MNGLIIKKLRLEKKEKQAWLAKGICSTSYLSKIESNQVSPNEEILNKLLERLGVKYINSTTIDETSFHNKLYALYKDAIEQRNTEEIKEKIESLIINSSDLYLYKNYLTYLIYITRIKLVLNELNQDIHTIDSFCDEMTPKEAFIHELNKVLYFYCINKYNLSHKLLKDLLKKRNLVHLHGWEQADLDTISSIIFLKQKSYIIALNYAENAINYYQKNLLYQRAIDLYLILGIANKNLGNCEEALSNYHLCQKLINDINLETYNGILSHNIGTLYSYQGLHQEAFSFYKKALSYKLANFNESYFITLLSIIKEFSKVKDYSNVDYWAKKGLNELKMSNLPDTLHKSYYFHFKIHSTYNTENNKTYDILKLALEHFTAIDDSLNIQKYTLVLAKYLRKQYRYKEAR